MAELSPHLWFFLSLPVFLFSLHDYSSLQIMMSLTASWIDCQTGTLTMTWSILLFRILDPTREVTLKKKKTSGNVELCQQILFPAFNLTQPDGELHHNGSVKINKTLFGPNLFDLGNHSKKSPIGRLPQFIC